MISVLIPVFNYNISALVTKLHNQLIEASIPFEILVCDHGTEPLFKKTNRVINALSFTTYSHSTQTIGRERTRQMLSEKAQYDWVLFLDADTLPVTDEFIKTYLPFLDANYDAVFGGILYQSKPPEVDFMLRWTYGRARESINAAVRNKQPYRAIVSANFMIRKSVFMVLNKCITGKEYGNDIYFAALLKSHATRLIHIDNQVYHLGIEKSDLYLSKNEEAVYTYLKLANNGSISFKDNRLLSYFTTLKRLKLNHVIAALFPYVKPSLRHHLLGARPHMTLLQFYRLGYLCFIDLKPVR